MKLEQKKGPFSAGSSFRVGATDARQYVHIGIQITKRQPIRYITDSVVPADIRITTNEGESEYRINDTGILEFDGNVGNTVTVTFLRDLPMETIIDIVYRPEGE